MLPSRETLKLQATTHRNSQVTVESKSWTQATKRSKWYVNLKMKQNKQKQTN